MWFTVCGTDWADGSGLSHVEYVLVVWGICFLGFNIYTQALCYPRNAWEQFVQLREFPRYYKTGKPEKIITAIEDDRVSELGVQEFKVTRHDLHSGEDETLWERRTELVQDCVGQLYGERGALYGLLPDTYGGSTRDRLRVYDSHKHALERLRIAKEHEEGKRMPVAGINYRGAVPRAADEQPSQHATARPEVARQRKRGV